MPEQVRQLIRDEGYMTLRELHDPVVQERVRELEPRFEMGKAIGRYRHAEGIARFIDQALRIVPRPGDVSATELWYTPRELLAAAPLEIWEEAGTPREQTLRELGLPLGGLMGVNEDKAAALLGPWFELQSGWLARDAATAQGSLEKLAERLPQMAAPGVYPSVEKRLVETRYYSMGKLTWGYIIYMIGLVVSVWALVTHWKTPWILSLIITAGAMLLHAYGIALRWQILGRIPVANMFEAITAAALTAAVLGFVLEVFLKKRVFALAGCACGFFGLVLGDQVVPGGGTVQAMMGILDDVMLRIHTVCIIFSYGLVFLAAVISAIYLIGYYVSRHPGPTFETSMVAMVLGAALYVMSYWAFRQAPGALSASGMIKLPWLGAWFTGLSVVLVVAIGGLLIARIRGTTLATLVTLLVASITVMIGNQDFIWGMGLSLAGGGLIVALIAGIRMFTQRSDSVISKAWAPELYSDGGRSWLANLDQCQRLILGLVFVLLFVGTILGAVWADYSWGRPWGWDPKEVFALNTWIIYIILIHLRFVVRERGLWTAWFSVLGCLMMAFNWCFVNFHIVGLHSYA
jgi:ABC-type transport system involved in cytochrome c biogenesis permease subunit